MNEPTRLITLVRLPREERENISWESGRFSHPAHFLLVTSQQLKPLKGSSRGLFQESQTEKSHRMRHMKMNRSQCVDLSATDKRRRRALCLDSFTAGPLPKGDARRVVSLPVRAPANTHGASV